MVYYSWRIFNQNKIDLKECIFLGFFGAVGFLSKYLFIYLLFSIVLLFSYFIFYKKLKKFDFKYFITIEVFILLLIPHLIWLNDNNYITVTYGLKRTGLDNSNIFDHVKFPIMFLLKQRVLLVPFFLLAKLMIKRIKYKINFKDKKFLFLFFVSIVPIILMLATSIITGSEIRTMWMTPFYITFGIFFIYIFKSQINLKKINLFLYGFIFLFFLSPALYSYISINQTDKRTDYPGKEIAMKVQYVWDQQFDNPINVVFGNEWNAGNLSYHLKSRPSWVGFIDQNKINNLKEHMCIDDICVGYKQ